MVTIKFDPIAAYQQATGVQCETRTFDLAALRSVTNIVIPDHWEVKYEFTEKLPLAFPSDTNLVLHTRFIVYFNTFPVTPEN